MWQAFVRGKMMWMEHRRLIEMVGREGDAPPSELLSADS